MNRLLASSVIIALLMTSGVSALADESTNVPVPGTAGESYQEVGNNYNMGEGDNLPSFCDVFQEGGHCCSSTDHDFDQDDLNLDELYPDELDLDEMDIIEVEINEDISIYEALSFLYLYEQVIHTPMEQNIALGFEKEELVITSAILRTSSINTGEEFSLTASKIVENLVLFSIYYKEGSMEDEISINSIEYTIEGQDEPLLVIFYEQGIEASYRITNEPPYDADKAGITIYGFGNDGEVFAEHTTVETMTETIGDILDTVDGSVHISEPILEEEWEELLEDLLDENQEAVEPFMGFAPASFALPVASVAPFSSNRIIAVSAGHCSTHVGASANGLHEYQLTWHVANVVRDELNRFVGITAILDRPTIHCRYYPGVWTTAASNHCLTQRVRDARAAGATVFVDIHFNSGPPSAHGAEVWIPNNRTNDGRHQEGLRAGNAILENLARLGITNRGSRTKDNAQGGDWFATNRIARELGMTGILVEGGFLTNTAEANRLRDPAFRQNLGVQIARGIAAAYGATLPEAPPQQLTSTTAATSVNNRDVFFDLRVNFNTDQWVSRVQFEVWGEINGQNDVRWYEGTRQGNNSWTGRADIRNHRETGRYQVRTWVTLTNGTRFNTSSTTFNVREATGGRVEIVNTNTNAGTFDVVVRGVSAPSSVDRVAVGVWTRGDQSDLRWNTGIRQADGSKRVTIRTADHNFHAGIYHVHAHIVTGNETLLIRRTTHHMGARPVTTVSAADPTGRETFFNLSVTNAEAFGDIQGVNFGVWSENSRQADLVWYGSTFTNGAWRATADIRRHRNPGRYRVNAWGVTPGNGRVFLGTTTFYVSAPTGGRVVIENINLGTGTFDAVVRGTRTPSSVDRVEFLVWTRGDQSDIRRSTAIRQADGSKRATIHTAHHHHHVGTYHVRAHITTGNGQLLIRETTHRVTSRPTDTGLTRIMGTSQTYVAQMVRNYRNTGHTFPTAALGMSLEAFAQLVLDEANREGVRAEVVWAQVMRETGWLQFGGCVRINQFNFGGLGATGGGNPGHSFPTVQIGLRAQVHHLVAYATTASVRHPSNRAHPVMRASSPWGPTGETRVNGTESPRFHFVPRGISPYVNWLGQGENPNHSGFWAADRNYGAALAAAIRVLLAS